MARSLAASRAPKREQDRPSRLRLWLKRRRGLARPAGLLVLGVAALGVLGTGLYLADPAGRVQALAESVAAFGDSAGLEVQEVDVRFVRRVRQADDSFTEVEVPRAEANTPQEFIDAALGVARGDPMLGFSPHEARERLQTLSWVEAADVERRLPGTILVRLREREAFAIWQHQNRFALIDAQGRELMTDSLGSFVRLPLVVGEGANAEAAAFYALLRAHAAILERTQALVRVGNRRWNLRLHNGVDVLLPEDHEAPALNRLSELHARHALLDRPLVAIDMRLPDRLVLRQQPAPEPTPQQSRRPGERAGGNRG